MVLETETHKTKAKEKTKSTTKTKATLATQEKIWATLQLSLKLLLPFLHHHILFQQLTNGLKNLRRL